MYKIFLAVWIVSWTFSITATDTAKPKKMNNFTLLVQIKGADLKKGHLLVAVYDKDGLATIANGDNFYLQKRKRIKKGISKVKFKKLPIGKYTIRVILDANRNGKLDEGETTGFSEANFIFRSDVTKIVTLQKK